MAITHVGTNTATGDAQTSLSVTKPAGAAEGDVAVAFVAQDSDLAEALSLPTGFTEVASAAFGGGDSSYRYGYKVLGASEPASYSFTTDSSEPQIASISVFRDVDNTTPIDVTTSTNTGNSGTPTATGVTTVTDGAVLVAAAAGERGGMSPFTPPTGMTELVDIWAGTTSGLGISGSVAWVEQATAGASGNKAFTASDTDTWGAALMALRPKSVIEQPIGLATETDTAHSMTAVKGPDFFKNLMPQPFHEATGDWQLNTIQMGNGTTVVYNADRSATYSLVGDNRHHVWFDFLPLTPGVQYKATVDMEPGGGYTDSFEISYRDGSNTINSTSETLSGSRETLEWTFTVAGYAPLDDPSLRLIGFSNGSDGNTIRIYFVSLEQVTDYTPAIIADVDTQVFDPPVYFAEYEAEEEGLTADDSPAPELPESFGDWITSIGGTITFGENKTSVQAASGAPFTTDFLRCTIPSGTSSPSDLGSDNSGTGWEAEFFNSSHAIFSYQVRFGSGFDWVLGGKIPGLYGGDSPTGGAPADQGFTLRMMWRESGQGELYSYHYNRTSSFGDSIGRGLFTFTADTWHKIEMEVILNTVDNNDVYDDGVVRIWFDGDPVFEVNRIVLRVEAGITIDGIKSDIFFGGTGAEYRSTKEETVDTGDFQLYNLQNVVKGTLGIASDTEIAHPMTAVKTVTLGLAEETDTAHPITSATGVVLGLAEETDTAHPMTAVKTVTLGLASDTEIAHPMTAARTVTLGLAEETDTAFAMTFPLVRLLGLAEETDTAFAMTAGAAVPIGLAEETDTAFAMTAVKTVTLGLAQETDTAFAMTFPLVRLLGLAEETDTAFAMTFELGRRIDIGLAQETDTAFAMVPLKSVTLGLAEETDNAFSVVPNRSVAIGIATVTNEAFAMTIEQLKRRILGRAEERDIAFPLSSGLPPFWWRFYSQSTAGGKSAKRRLRPLVLTDRVTGTQYVIRLGDGMLLELHEPDELLPYSDEIFEAFQEPTMKVGPFIIRIFVTNGVLDYEHYPFHVRKRPILFSRKVRPNAKDAIYELTLERKVLDEDEKSP